jgi:hypothetical protein
MTCTDSIIAITAGKLQNPLSLGGGPATVDAREVDSPSIEIHANILSHGTPPLADAKLLAAVDPSVVLDAALAWTLDVLAAFRHAVAVVVIMIVVVVVQVLVPKVVDEHVSDAPVR